MSGHIDPAVLEALRFGIVGWQPGMGAIRVRTESGSIYIVDNQGKVTGGKHLPDNNGQLSGAVYRPGGPIRPNQVLVGLNMEILRPREPTPDNPRAADVIITSPVEAIMDAQKGAVGGG